jgi:hypothetical protein
MQTIINVHQTDILWRFYTKAFTLKGEAVESPKNLCRYVQTAATGFGMWLNREVSLVYLWLAFLATIVVLTVMAFISSAAPGLWIISVAALPVSLALISIMTAAVVVSLARLKDWLMERASWVIGLAMLLFFGIGAYLGVRQFMQEGVPPEMYWALIVMKWMLYVLLSLVVFRLVVIPLLKQLPDWYIDKLVSSFEKLEPSIDHLAGFLQKVNGLIVILGHFMVAKKQQVCLPVNPPADFKAEPKA